MKKVILLTLILTLGSLVVPSAAGAEEGEFMLDEVVVTASRYKELLSETPVSVDVITEEDIERKPAQNAADLLRDVPGVNLQ